MSSDPEWFCEHKSARREYTPIIDRRGDEIGALCLECGNDQYIYQMAASVAKSRQLDRKMAAMAKAEAQHARAQAVAHGLVVALKTEIAAKRARIEELTVIAKSALETIDIACCTPDPSCTCEGCNNRRLR